MTQNSNTRRISLLVLLLNEPAAYCGQSNQVKKTRIRFADGNPSWTTWFDECSRASRIRDDVIEGRLPLSKFKVLVIIEPPSIPRHLQSRFRPPCGHAWPYLNQPARFLVRQRPEQDHIDHAERRGRGADSERRRQHRE